MLDAHCHLNFAAFDSDREQVIGAARGAGVRGLIIAGYGAERRQLARELAARPGIYATAGLHPWAVAEHDEAWLDTELAQLKRDLEDDAHDKNTGWCGLGELGLDYLRAKDPDARALQEKAFVAQLGLAREWNLPVVIHAVKCHNTLYKIMRDEGMPEAGGMMHGYSGSARQVGNFLMLNLDISVGTSITYPNARKAAEVIAAVPHDRLLVETDAPDRPPYRPDGSRAGDGGRNEPAYLPLVVEAVAGQWNCSAQEVARRTEQNARRRFDLDDDFL